MLAFSYLGSEYLTPLLLLVALIWLARRARPWAAYLAINVFGANLSQIVLKHSLGLPRPDPPLFPYWQAAGYPSGHTFIGLAFGWGILLYLNMKQPWWWSGARRRLLAALLMAWPLIVGGSRVYLDAHWASDIVGGLLLGTTYFLASLWIFGRWLARRGMTAAEAAD